MSAAKGPRKMYVCFEATSAHAKRVADQVLDIMEREGVDGGPDFDVVVSFAPPKTPRWQRFGFTPRVWWDR